MGLFDRHKPADGKTDEQSKAEMDAMFERFGQIVDERLKPVSESVSGLKTEWETIKAEATKQPEVDRTPRNADGTPRELTAEEKRAALDNAFATQNVQNAARFIERDVLDAMPADYADLKPTIREMFKNTPVQRKMQADYAEYCENCVDLAIAKEARKNGLRRNSETKEFFLEDKGSGSSTPDSILNSPELAWNNNGRTMSAREQLLKLGIDPKKFEESAKNGVV